ncbi:MAG: hypothetical protein IJT94_08580 [Oscillibacter sp.]|nr:hypothetical protein [Oscillibacter sp.]
MTESETGTLNIQDRTLRAVLPPLCAAVLASALLTAAAVPLLFPLLHITGSASGAAAAILAYVLFRVLFPYASRRFPGGGTRRVTWEVTADALTIDGRTIARNSIKNIHIWPNRDALGHTLPGWTVNIETTGKNLLLRVPRQNDGDSGENENGGNDGENGDGGNNRENGDSGEELRTLVRALGYENRWPEA